MNFALTDTQKMYQEKARKFAETVLRPGVIDRDAAEEFPMDLFKKAGEEGLIGVQFNPKYGGKGEDPLCFNLMVEEFAKVDASFAIAYAISHTFCSGLEMFGTEEQMMQACPPIFRGETLGCFALTEPDSGSDAGSAKTEARLEGDHYILNGQKHFITNSPLARYCMLIVNTDLSKGPKGLTAFLVDLQNTPGIKIGHIENKCGLRPAKVAEILIENAVIPADCMIGEEGKGFKYALTTLNVGRLGVAAQGLGIAEGAFEIAKEYMKERQQFGKPIWKNQYPAFIMADLATEIDMCKYLLYKGIWEQENGIDFAISACKAKLACTNLAMKVTTDCIQNMGGAGYMREQHVERMFRDAKITQIYEGTNEIQRLVISGAIFA